MEKCANCERQIGNLEPAHVWKDSIVCADCLYRLSKARETVPPDTTIQPDEKKAADSQHSMVGWGAIAAVLLVGSFFIYAIYNDRPAEERQHLRDWLNAASCIATVGGIIGFFVLIAVAVRHGTRSSRL